MAFSRLPKSRGCCLLPVSVETLVADIIRQFAGADKTIVVMIGKALQAFHQGVREGAMAAAKLRAFDRKFARTGGHQPQHRSRRRAQLFHRGADIGGFQIADIRGAGHIGHHHHAAYFGQFVIHQRLNLRHRQSGRGQILRIAVIRQNVRTLGYRRCRGRRSGRRSCLSCPRDFSAASGRHCEPRLWWRLRRSA